MSTARSLPRSANLPMPGWESRFNWKGVVPMEKLPRLVDPEPAARGCVALLSDWFPRTTGEIVHVDGGVHAIGA